MNCAIFGKILSQKKTKTVLILQKAGWIFIHLSVPLLIMGRKIRPTLIGSGVRRCKQTRTLRVWL